MREPLKIKSKNDKFCGLYGIPLLALAFKLFPYSIAEFAIKIGYENPLIGMSNIGIIPDDYVELDNLKCNTENGIYWTYR